MKNQTEPLNVAAYGGAGWSPRSVSLQEELGTVWCAAGLVNEYAPLKSVLLHRPGPELTISANPDAVQMLAPINLGVAQSQHDAMAQAYRQLGVMVHYVEPETRPLPNQMFVADLMFMTPEGVILARPASTVRAGEERQVARRLADLGIPIVRTIRGHGTFEGADALWLNERTVMLGRGLRTNDEGAAQVTVTLKEMGVEVIQVDLPFGTMHLMGMLRFIDENLAVAWPRRLAHRAVDALETNGYRVIYLPDETEAAHRSAFNFVTVAPRHILMPAGNPVTQAYFEELDVICQTVEMFELRKAAGAIGCLTGILQRV